MKPRQHLAADDRDGQPQLAHATTEPLGVHVAQVTVHAYRIPTKTPEEDGTIHWDSTTLVLVDVKADNNEHGLGYTYASTAAATVIHDLLTPIVIGCDIGDIRAIWSAMIAAVRNVGRPGIASMAISAVDSALWDLKGKLNDLALFRLLGAHRREVVIYGSGGFTTYTDAELINQLSGWVNEGITQVKMKIGTDWGAKPEEDIRRVRIARQAIGPHVELFVDANGAYQPKQAIDLAHRFAEYDVSWFEEPVSSDQLRQLAFVRSEAPQRVAAGEYGYDPWYFRSMLEAAAVDVLQADATRCLGVTGFLEAGTEAHSFAVPFSAHTAPALHAQLGCVVPEIVNVEYFFDHVRIEHMLFEGGPKRIGGCLRPDPNCPGLGFGFKWQDAEKFRVAG